MVSKSALVHLTTLLQTIDNIRTACASSVLGTTENCLPDNIRTACASSVLGTTKNCLPDNIRTTCASQPWTRLQNVHVWLRATYASKAVLNFFVKIILLLD